jgi:hypothetical protein
MKIEPIIGKGNKLILNQSIRNIYILSSDEEMVIEKRILKLIQIFI